MSCSAATRSVATLTLDRYRHLLPWQAEQVALRLDEMDRQACRQTIPNRSIWRRRRDPRGMDAGSPDMGTSEDPADQVDRGGRDRRRSGDRQLRLSRNDPGVGASPYAAA